LQTLFKELVSHRTLLHILSDTVKSVTQLPDNRDTTGCTSAFEKKMYEIEEMLAEVELKANETRAELRNRLLQV
jgi:hypothetical protein